MATAKIQRKITEEDFICKICQDVLRNDPHSLPCLHNYCGNCVNQIQKVVQDDKKGILCPVCKNFCTNEEILPNDLIKSIVLGFANLYNKELLNQPIDGKSCRQCKKSDVSSFCVTCECELCNVCQNTHLEFKEFKHHHVVAIGDAKHAPAINVVKMCTIHPGNPIKVHCKPCKKAICFECKVEDHDTHVTESVDSALSIIIPEVQSKLQSIESRCEAVKQLRETVESINETTTVNFRDVIQQAKAEMESKISKLRSDFSALQDEVLSQAPLKQGELIKQDIDHTISCMETLYNWAKTLTEVTQGPGVLHELQNELRGRLDAYADDELDTRDAEDYIENPPDQVVFTPTAVPNLVGKMEFIKKSDKYSSVKPENQIPELKSKTDKQKESIIPKTKVVNENVKQSGVVEKHPSNLINSLRHAEENFSNLKNNAPNELKSFKHKHRLVRFCYFNGQIWTACNQDNCIDVYTVEGECIGTISSIQGPLALQPLTSQHMLVAARSGLYTLDVNMGNTESQLLSGECWDVHVTEACIAVLGDGQDGRNESVRILSVTPPYAESAHFNLTHKYAYTLLVHRGHVYISAGQPFHNITKYNMSEQYGEPGETQPGELGCPRLCLTDSSGCILVADKWNNRIQLLSDGHWSVVKEIKIKDPTDVIVVHGQMFISSLSDRKIYVYNI